MHFKKRIRPYYHESSNLKSYPLCVIRYPIFFKTSRLKKEVKKSPHKSSIKAITFLLNIIYYYSLLINQK